MSSKPVGFKKGSSSKKTNLTKDRPGYYGAGRSARIRKNKKTPSSVSFNKIKVRVKNPQDIDFSSTDSSTITFKNLVAYFYLKNNTIKVKAKAEAAGLDNVCEVGKRAA